MKKVFAILAVASMVSFASCNNAPKTEEGAEEAAQTETVAPEATAEEATAPVEGEAAPAEGTTETPAAE